MATIEAKNINLELGKLIIEAAKEEDAEEILELMKQLNQETDFLIREPGEFKLTVEQEREFIKKKREDDKEIFLTAKLEGKIVGTLGLSTDKMRRYSHKAEFGMAILKDYWGYGIGSNFLKVMLSWSEEKGYVKISLRVDATNQRAKEVYKRLGFKEEGLLEKNKYLGDGQYRDEIVMAIINKDNL